MKETITVKIIEGGKAIELNPLGGKPNTKDTQSHQLDDFFKSKIVEQWQKAEQNLRTFEIESEIKNQESPCSIAYVINSIHQAKILENGKIEII